MAINYGAYQARARKMGRNIGFMRSINDRRAQMEARIKQLADDKAKREHELAKSEYEYTVQAARAEARRIEQFKQAGLYRDPETLEFSDNFYLEQAKKDLLPGMTAAEKRKFFQEKDKWIQIYKNNMPVKDQRKYVNPETVAEQYAKQRAIIEQNREGDLSQSPATELDKLFNAGARAIVNPVAKLMGVKGAVLERPAGDPEDTPRGVITGVPEGTKEPYQVHPNKPVDLPTDASQVDIQSSKVVTDEKTGEKFVVIVNDDRSVNKVPLALYEAIDGKEDEFVADKESFGKSKDVLDSAVRAISSLQDISKVYREDAFGTAGAFNDAVEFINALGTIGQSYKSSKENVEKALKGIQQQDWFLTLPNDIQKMVQDGDVNGLTRVASNLAVEERDKFVENMRQYVETDQDQMLLEKISKAKISALALPALRDMARAFRGGSGRISFNELSELSNLLDASADEKAFMTRLKTFESTMRKTAISALSSMFDATKYGSMKNNDFIRKPVTLGNREFPDEVILFNERGDLVKLISGTEIVDGKEVPVQYLVTSKGRNVIRVVYDKRKAKDAKNKRNILVMREYMKDYTLPVDSSGRMK